MDNKIYFLKMDSADSINSENFIEMENLKDFLEEKGSIIVKHDRHDYINHFELIEDVISLLEELDDNRYNEVEYPDIEENLYDYYKEKIDKLDVDTFKKLYNDIGNINIDKTENITDILDDMGYNIESLTLRGYSQSDWATCIYNTDVYNKFDIDYIEDTIFNMSSYVKIFITDDIENVNVDDNFEYEILRIPSNVSWSNEKTIEYIKEFYEYIDINDIIELEEIQHIDYELKIKQ